MERTFDGQGGAYGHQLQAPLGRFARINANLSFEYDTLADVPNWESTGSGAGSTYTYQLKDRPRKLSVSHDGSGGTTVEGAFSNVLTTVESLGPFRITFKNVNITDDSQAFVGITDQDVSGKSSSGSTITHFLQNAGTEVQSFSTVIFDDGTGSKKNHSNKTGSDFSIEVRNGEASFLTDGDVQSIKTSDIPSGDNLSPFISLKDRSSKTRSNAEITVEQITVEPLPEVLQQ
jgi:hypothetical protein